MKTAIAVLAFALAVFSPYAAAQADYPSRPIAISVGYAAGGGTDLLTRMLAAELGKVAGREVTVVNQPGGTGTVALSALTGARPDGYTLGVTTSSAVTIVPFTMDGAPDLLDRITPIAAVGRLRNGFLVKSDSPHKSIKELIEFARKNPGTVSIGIQGAGSSGALALGTLALQENIKWTLVPYPGEAPAMAAVLGGHITAATATSSAWARFVEAGQLKLIASMDAERFDSVPNAPTLVEQGYPNSSLIFVLAGPKGMPPALVERINQLVAQAMRAPAFVEFVRKNGMEIKKPLTGDALYRYLVDDRAAMGAMAQKVGFKSSGRK